MPRHVLAALFLCVLAGLAAAGPSAAATTIYPTSYFSNVGVANPNRLLGNNPNNSAIDRNDSIGLTYGADITNFVVSFVVTSYSGNTTWLWMRAGRRAGATFTNAAAPGLLGPTGLPTANIYVRITGPGTYYLNTAAFGASCTLLGGCNSILFGNSTFSAAGSTFQLSMVGATPEPQAWALMILGFAGVAFRLKQTRRRQSADAKRVKLTIFAAIASKA